MEDDNRLECSRRQHLCHSNVPGFKKSTEENNTEGHNTGAPPPPSLNSGQNHIKSFPVGTTVGHLWLDIQRLERKDRYRRLDKSLDGKFLMISWLHSIMIYWLHSFYDLLIVLVTPPHTVLPPTAKKQKDTVASSHICHPSWNSWSTDVLWHIYLYIVMYCKIFGGQ